MALKNTKLEFRPMYYLFKHLVRQDNKNMSYTRLSQVYEIIRKKAIKIFFKLKIKSLTFYITISAYSHYISAYFIQVHMAMKVRRE